MKIGFFDSGLGGLVVLRSVMEQLPDYEYEYYGDTRHLPYGDKTEEEIYELTKVGMEWLFAQDCGLIIIACNTASAETLRKLQDTYLPVHYPDRRILGVIVPMVEEVVANPLITQALLIGTTRTIDSGKYEREFAKYPTAPKLRSHATPELVALIETNQLEAASTVLAPLLGTLRARNGDALLLGCTHYTLLKELIARNWPHGPIMCSQDEIIPRRLTTYLHRHPEIASQLGVGQGLRITLTAARPDYESYFDSLKNCEINILS